jgi:hypothetical protein
MAIDNHTDTDRSASRAADQNGAQTNGATPDGQAKDRMARAEEMVDQLAEKVAHYTALFGRQILWLGARLREEAEDIWEEAQSIRRGEKP